jgi:heme oxygenase
MLRSAALHTDLTTLHRTTPVTLSVALSRFPSPAVQDFVTHVRAIVADRPHVLVAYAWVFYMALFSGGRWIRAKLVEAGGDFWQQDGLPGGCYNLDGAAARQRAPATSNEVEDEEDWSQGNEGEVEGFSRDGGKPLDEAGLSFLFFPGGNDGEDIKAEFKARLAAAENLLSVSEREEVVEEAREIFRRCIELVHELDEIMGTPVDLLDLRPLKSTKASQGLTSSQAEVAQGLGISNVIANAADFRVRYSLSKPRRLWLDAAGRIGTVMVLSSVAWFAAHHLRDLVLDSDAWINVWPILR